MENLVQINIDSLRKIIREEIRAELEERQESDSDASVSLQTPDLIENVLEKIEELEESPEIESSSVKTSDPDYEAEQTRVSMLPNLDTLITRVKVRRGIA